MKIEFDPLNFDERAEMRRYLNDGKYCAVLQDIYNHLRSRLKHENLSEEVEEALSRAQDVLYEAQTQRGIDIWEE